MHSPETLVKHYVAYSAKVELRSYSFFYLLEFLTSVEHHKISFVLMKVL